MKIIKLIMGAFETNSYIVMNGSDALIIDPASSAEKILYVLKEKELNLSKIILTHGHYDHTAAVAELQAATGAKVYIHENDAPMLCDPDKSFARIVPEPYKPCEADEFIKDGDIIEVGKVWLAVMHTPGHSAGSVMFVFDSPTEGIIFSGDTIFEGSIGRADGWSGDEEVQRQTMELIKAMKGNYQILSGHGGETTLGHEKQYNPYLRSCPHSGGGE